LVPVGEHPIFPGSSASLSVTQKQYDELKEIDTVFATIVKNDNLLNQNQMDKMLNVSNKLPFLGLPPIKNTQDIYNIGTLC